MANETGFWTFHPSSSSPLLGETWSSNHGLEKTNAYKPLGGLECLVWATTEKLAAAKGVTDTQDVGLFARGMMDMPGLVHALTSGTTGKCHRTKGFRFSHYSHYVSCNFFPPSNCSSWILTFNWHSCQHRGMERQGFCLSHSVAPLLFSADQPWAGQWTSYHSPSSSGKWVQWAFFPHQGIKDLCGHRDIYKSKLKV